MDEKEQLEAIKAWWQENRWYIISGLLISAAIVGGWRYWQEHKVQQAEAASVRYEAVLLNARLGDTDAVRSRVDELRKDYSRTPYASLASLRLAAMQVNEGDFRAAANALRWAMDNTSDDELAKVARLRLARVQIQLGDTDAAMQLLARGKPGKFSALYEEARGDALMAAGDREGARSAYETALANMEPQLGDPDQLRRKLRNVDLPREVIAVHDLEPAPEAAPREQADLDTAGDSDE